LREADDDAGVYIAARRTGTGTGWSGAIVYRSIDGGASYSEVITLSTEAKTGTVVTAPSGQTYTWNDSTALVVDMLNDKTLESRTEAAVIGGANLAAIGAHGRWHLCQFMNQTLLSPGQYSVSRMLLGRRGTEHNISTVVVGDEFVLVSGPGIYRLPLQVSQIGQGYLYRPVTSGQAFDEAVSVAFTGDGEALMPFSPVDVRGSRDGSNNLTITWVRRDRLSETLPDGVLLPNSEDSEEYVVEIMNGVTVVRTITGITSETTSYSAANQTTDFGSPQSSLTVRVYQLSAIVGRGQYAEATI
jgi:hypothetical protein